jgi:hypothetical protein
MTMAPHLWLPLNPQTVDQEFNKRHPATPLPQSFSWAVWAAEGSDYLDKLDATHPGSSYQHIPPTGAHPDLIDIAHVRWATGNALTAIDLCAATIGRLFCGVAGQRELSLRDFDPGNASHQAAVTANRAALAPPSQDFLIWVDDALADQLYQELHDARNPFTHSWLQRKLFRGGPAPANRTEFEVVGTGYGMNARKMVEDSASLAIGRVKAFIEVVNQY